MGVGVMAFNTSVALSAGTGLATTGAGAVGLFWALLFTTSCIAIRIWVVVVWLLLTEPNTYLILLALRVANLEDWNPISHWYLTHNISIHFPPPSTMSYGEFWRRIPHNLLALFVMFCLLCFLIIFCTSSRVSISLWNLLTNATICAAFKC